MKIILLVVGSCATPKQFGSVLKKTGIAAEIGQVHRINFLGIGRILRKVLEI